MCRFDICTQYLYTDIDAYLFLHFTVSFLRVEPICGFSTVCLMQVVVFQSCPILCNPVDCSLLVSSVHEIFHECWSGLPFPPPEGLPKLQIKPGYPALQAESLPSEPLS